MFGVSLTTDTYARGRVVNILVACPACGYEFRQDERRFKHLEEHAPEDFGLDPLGVVDDRHDEPLFGGVER